jgi:polysaccharide export outer membrane protein
MRAAVALGFAALLGACASFPDDGPSARSVAGAAAKQGAGPYALVDLDYRISQVIASTPGEPMAGLASAESAAPHDLIGAGDVLSIQVFEPSASNLFSTRERTEGPGPEELSHVVVSDDGAVQIPYAGPVQVAGLAPSAAAQAIQRALRGKVFSAQVLVSVASSNANSVTVVGDVRNVGRYALTAHSDRLLDMLAAAGGPTHQAADIEVVMVRGALTVNAPLLLLMNQPDENVRLAPGDQVRLLYRPRKFSTFGALGKSAEFSIDDDTLSLAGALTRSSELDTNSAKPHSVLVFRFGRPSWAARLQATPKGVPMVYRLNLRDPAGYLIANSFDVESGDLLYVPRSDVTETRKFLDLVSVISQVTYNARVSSVIH